MRMLRHRVLDHLRAAQTSRSVESMAIYLSVRQGQVRDALAELEAEGLVREVGGGAVHRWEAVRVPREDIDGVLGYLRDQDEPQSVGEIAHALVKDVDRVERALHELRRQGLVSRYGNLDRAPVLWQIVPDAPEAEAVEPVTRTREVEMTTTIRIGVLP